MSRVSDLGGVKLHDHLAVKLSYGGWPKSTSHHLRRVWKVDSTVNTNKQGFLVASKWCRILSIHSRVDLTCGLVLTYTQMGVSQSRKRTPVNWLVKHRVTPRMERLPDRERPCGPYPGGQNLPQNHLTSHWLQKGPFWVELTRK